MKIIFVSLFATFCIIESLLITPIFEKNESKYSFKENGVTFNVMVYTIPQQKIDCKRNVCLNWNKLYGDVKSGKTKINQI